MQRIDNIIKQGKCANILQSLHKHGISGIPLNGKQPLARIRWKQYQRKLPETYELDKWSKIQFSSYGIICGKISKGLVVIDFDCPHLYEKFSQQFSTLADTYTVKTRRGYHVYLSTTFPVASRQFKNCDIKGENSYVVGAGSVINGTTYVVHKQAKIQQVTFKEYQAILNWLCPDPDLSTIQTKTNNTNNSHFNMIFRYVQLVPEKGRNNALYATACEARSRGISLQQTIDTLARKHACTSPISTHHPESPSQRYREAIHTIQSAYRSTSNKQLSLSGLPNSIREKLLQIQKSTIVARLIDGIKFSESKNKWVTLGQLLRILKHFQLSKKSILRTLSGDLAKINGKRIFKQIRYNDYITSYVSQGDKTTPNSKVGRKTQFIYQIPSIEYLCKILKVEQSISDSLRAEDLCSAGAYRRALHRELVRRLSPMIRVDWHAQRLGVNRRTIFRYNVRLGVIATPMIERESLSSENIHSLSKDSGFTPGRWLETQTGKRYPALKSIANNLVTEKNYLVNICRQLPTRYSLPYEIIDPRYPVQLPDHLKSRAQLLVYSNVHEVLSPDWATKKYDLGGYLAVYNGYEWTFRPPLRVIAYPLVKQYEDGLVYFIRPLKS